MNMPLVSVVMPVYNSSRFLRQAIESVLSQTYTNIELLVIDDCSSDESLNIAREYASRDNRIIVIANETNKGVAKTRNRGIDRAKGKYIALIDSDDTWKADKLEKQVCLAQLRDADIVYTSYGLIDENGKAIKQAFIVPESTDYEQMLNCNVIGASTVMLRASALGKHRFNGDIYHEDYMMWMELLSGNICAVGCAEVLVDYRQVSGARNENKVHAAVERWKVYKILGVRFTKRIRSFSRYVVSGINKYYISF